MSSILDLDALLTRIASLTKRLIDYRTFGILLLNEATQRARDEAGGALRQGRRVEARASSAKASSAGRRCTRSRCSSPTCRKDPRYINLVDDARSELVIPMLIKDRCIGVFDLESPELDAFTKEHKELLTLLASQAAVAIDNAQALRGGAAQRGAHREGAALRAARAGGAAADRAAEDGSTASTSPAASSRRASSGATSTTSSCPSRTRSSSRSATCPARARRRRCTARLPPSWCGRARCGAASRPIASASPACCRR